MKWHVDTETFPQKVKKAREKAGLSQMEVAGKAGINQAFVSRLETGQGLETMSPRPVIAICNVLKTDPRGMFAQE